MRLLCTLDACPPGLFIFEGCLGFKSEYRRANGSAEAFVVETGEAFWGGTSNAEACNALMVLPVEIVDTSGLRFSELPEEE